MKPVSVLLCSYSYGLGDGIAHMDEAMAGLDPARFRLRRVVLRPGFEPGRSEETDGVLHISLAGAYPMLCGLLREADVLHVNGPFDPVAANAARAVGVPAIVEVVHQVECGGLHPAIDAVVCVSELVRSVQSHPQAQVIHNGIDIRRFAFAPGRRHPDTVRVVQVANASKVLHWELGEAASLLSDPSVECVMAGDRAPVHGLPSLGLVREMPEVYKSADLLFLLERQAAFGLVFAEAMACGTLPIASGDSGASLYIEHGKNGWIAQPGSLADAAELLRRAVDAVRGPKAEAMRERARETIAERFTRPAMLRRYEAVYERLGRRPRREPAPPEAWMDLCMALLLFREGNAAAFAVLERFIAKSGDLAPYFFTHPVGQSTIGVFLRELCPALNERGYAALVRGLCARLRGSGVAGPLIDRAERPS